MEILKTALENTKLILGTLAIISSSVIGTYTFLTNTFVTQSQAKEITQQLQVDIKNVSQSNAYNRLSIIQLQLLRLEEKRDLSLTEQRLYESLKKQESSLIDMMNTKGW